MECWMDTAIAQSNRPASAAANRPPQMSQVVTVSARPASASTRVSKRPSTPRMRVMASLMPLSSAARRGSRSAKAQAVAPVWVAPSRRKLSVAW
jgi:hypothetical protein